MKRTDPSDVQRVYVCVHCGMEATELYHCYSPTVLKIAECSACKLPADSYIECDIVLILLDLFLQKLASYRHVLCNTPLKTAWRLLLIFILCDAYYSWVEQNTAIEGKKAVDIYDLEWHFYVNIVHASVEAFVTILVAAPFCLCIWKRTCQPRALIGSMAPTTGNALKAMVNKLQIGFYGNVLVLLAVIWEQHQSASFMVLTRVFLFASQVQVFRALTNVGVTTAAPVVLLAQAMGKAARHVASWTVR